jgi:hypothetical protein
MMPRCARKKMLPLRHEQSSSSGYAKPQIQVTATLTSQKRREIALEYIVGSLSLDPSVTAARWRVVNSIVFDAAGPQRLREGIAAFFDAQLGWLEQAMKTQAGIENGTILQGVCAAPIAKLVLSTLVGMLLLGRLFDKRR